MSIPRHSSSSAPPAPASTGLKAARIPSAAVPNGSSASSTSSTNVALFVTNLRLLDLDLRGDWPGIDAHTFSTHNAQQNQKHRIRCVEWSLFRLFERWDAEDTRNKLQPFFPPLEPLQSLNLRAALFRCLSELKKNGILGRETVLRKTMLDECKGEKLEEVLLVFSTAVLRKVVVGKRIRGGDAFISRRLATANSLSVHESESMIPLAIAHRASLTALLRKKRALRGRHEEFRALLELKQRRAIEENEQLRKVVDDRAKCPTALKEEVQSLRRQFRENWLGDSDWVDTIFDGDRHQDDLLLTTPLKEVCRHVINGGLLDLEMKKPRGLLEDLEQRLKEQQEWIATWKGFLDGLLKRRPAQATSVVPDDRQEPKQAEPGFTFTAHKSLLPPPKNTSKLPQIVTSVDHTSVPSVSEEYERLIRAMKTELADVGKRKTRNDELWRDDKTDEMDTEIEESGQASTATSQFQHGAIRAGHQEPTAPGDKEALSTMSYGGGTKEDARTQPPSTPLHQREFSNDLSSLARTRADGNPQLDEDINGNSPVSEGGDTKLRLKRPTIPPIFAMSPPSTAAKIASAPNVDAEDQDKLAEDIIARVTNPEPSPATKRPTLLERTRMSMAFSSTDDAHQTLPEGVSLRIEKKRTEAFHNATKITDPGATLLERTRQSMSLLPAPAHRLQKPTNKPRKSIFPTNQFETPQKQRPSRGAIKESTPEEDLFSQDADYASIFKSRPKIALSPTFSPMSEVKLPPLDSLMDSVDGNAEDHGNGDDYTWGSSPLVRAKAKAVGI
ncbi:MAG: hypothetical protein M1835_004868 [Candelina submexicana]|nr:MAG: hypothetical protein M1835_004868 [Candelina submexicana]